MGYIVRLVSNGSLTMGYTVIEGLNCSFTVPFTLSIELHSLGKGFPFSF